MDADLDADADADTDVVFKDPAQVLELGKTKSPTSPSLFLKINNQKGYL